VRFHGLFLTASLDERIARVTARAHDASDADVAVARQQETYERGAMDWTEIDASRDVAPTLKAVRTAIGSHAR
jgi:predicted kinase